jgi:hypothetical protein
MERLIMTSNKSPPPGRRGKSSRASRQRHARAHASRDQHKEAGNAPRRWSQQVMEHSDALDLETDVFKSDSPQAIAESLKRSSEGSRRRKGTPFQSAMSMLNFYINRAGRTLPKPRRDVLQRAKQKLREAFVRGS